MVTVVMFTLPKSGAVSRSQHAKDNITPHKTAVLVLMREYLELKVKPLSERNDWLFSEKDKQEFMFTLIELFEMPDMHLGQLRIYLAGRVKEKLLQHLEDQLRKLDAEGLHAFYEFFERLNKPLSVDDDVQTEFTLLNKTSVMGVFVRSVLISFKVLTMEACKKVVEEFQRYFRCGKEEEDEPSLAQLSSKSSSQSKRAITSKRQAERRVIRLAFLLEHNEQAAGTSVEVAEEMLQLLNTYPDLSKAHYVQYLNYMRAKEYSGAIDSLHRYFDKYTISETEATVEDKKAKSEDDVKRCFRYAALNLASLYSRFGHRDQAVHSVKEAIKLAQESNDRVCLQHALGWLLHVGGDIANASEPDVMQSAVTSASSLGLWDLCIASILAMTKNNCGSLATPSELLTFISKAGLIQSKLPILMKNSLNIISLSGMTLKSAIWMLYGRLSMSGLVAVTVLHTDTVDQYDCHNGEAECLAICTLSAQHFCQGWYHAAEELINIAKERFPKGTQFSVLWMFIEQWQVFERARLHLDVVTMKLACENMSPIRPLEAKLRKAILHKFREDYGKSSAILNELRTLILQSGSKGSQAEFYVRVLLELIDLECVRGNLQNACKIIPECLFVAEEHQLHYQIAICKMYTAHVQLMSGEPKQALTHIRGVLSYLLICGSEVDKARAQLLFVKCAVSAAQTSSQSVPSVLRTMTPILESVCENFHNCEAFNYAKDAFLYTAIVYNMLGKQERRNEFAFKYKLLLEQMGGYASRMQATALI